MKSLLLTLLFSISYLQSQNITTQFGPIQGTQNGTIYQFLGIPFAKPPVGNLRWKAPENPVAWSSPLVTNSFAPVCPQKKYDQGGTTSTIVGNEDCLYLNVWTPQLVSGNLPVLVYIHGGGNQQGGASEEGGGTPLFFGKNMAERGNAVVVTLQYRLGPLGFLAHPGLETENTQNISGNYAVMDQLLALQWVQNNIAQFGGDPTKVMIFGESAGGVNVGNLLTSPLASGLFQRACIQSAAPVVKAYSVGITNGIDYVNSFTTTGTETDKIAYMRTLSPETLVANENPPLSGGAVGMNWTAVLDNYYFTQTAYSAFNSGNFNKVPLLMGSNSEEMSLSAPQTVSPAMVTALKLSIFPISLMNQANILYPSGTTNEEARSSYINLLTDSQFTATTRRTVQCVSRNQTQPVWRYFFTYKHSIPSLATLGSYHGMELLYVFNNFENSTIGTGSLFQPSDANVQNALLHYWVNFATTGNPNGNGLPSWPQYDAATDPYIELKSISDGTQFGVRTAQSDLLDTASNFTPCTSSLETEIPTLERLTVYPNPTNGVFRIEIPSQDTFVQVTVFTFLGQQILKSQQNILDLSEQSSGVYWLYIVTKEGTTIQRLLKK
ncbi:MAG: hypothetical protein RLZZ500_572 [Bacteroidota bacterium]|jgi:para-nitrobenzyl esterase